MKGMNGGVGRRGKTGRHGKVGVKKRRWGLAQLLYYPQGNERQSPTVENTGIDHSTWRIPQGSGIFKGWEDKRGPGCIPETFTLKE